MKILDFTRTFQRVPAFSLREVEKAYPDFERENLLNWQKKGYLIRLRNGWYSLSNNIDSRHDLYFIANKIYHPSYVSMESALSHYGWIPEGVFAVTSLTTLKTKTFQTPAGSFIYRSIKPDLFFGYKILTLQGLNVKIAEPEKTLLDFLYFQRDITNLDDLMSFRFNLPEMRAVLDMKKLDDYASLFDSMILNKRIELFKKALENDESF